MARHSCRRLPLPADLGDAAGARRRCPLAVHRPESGRRRGSQSAAARRGISPVHPATRSTRSPSSSAHLTGRLSSFAAETGLRTARMGRARAARCRPAGRAVTVQRRVARRRCYAVPEDGAVTAAGAAHRRAPRRARALPPRLDTPILFPAAKGGYIGLDTWRTREWYDGARRRRARPARPVPPTPHVRDRGACRRNLDVRARTSDGHVGRDDRPHLRAPGPRLGGVDPRPPRRESRSIWRRRGVRRDGDEDADAANPHG